MIESLKAIGHSVDRVLPVRRKERRRGSRSEHLRGRYLVVDSVGGEQTVRIVDSHHGGLAIASPTPCPVGALVTFRGGQDSPSQRYAKIQGGANVVYCRSYGERRFLVGLELTQVRFSSLRTEATDLNPRLRGETL